MSQSHSRDRDRGALEDPYRVNRLEVSYRGWCCCGCGTCCIGHPGREVYGPALKALRSHLHKGTTVGRAQRAVHWAWRGVWGTSFLLLPLRWITSTHVIPNQCTAATLSEQGPCLGMGYCWPSTLLPLPPSEECNRSTCWSRMHWQTTYLVLRYWLVQYGLITVLMTAHCHKRALACKVYPNTKRTASESVGPTWKYIWNDHTNITAITPIA